MAIEKGKYEGGLSMFNRTHNKTNGMCIQVQQLLGGKDDSINFVMNGLQTVPSRLLIKLFNLI